VTTVSDARPTATPLGSPRGATRWRAATSATALRVAVMGGAAVILAQLQSLHPDRALVVCPLRAMTGVPCPLCGGTTAAMSLARLRPVEALRANPFVVLGALLVAVAPLAARRHVRRLPLRVAMGMLGCLLVAAELWQLVRFDLLPIRLPI
jgi:hypothetical protein